MDKEFEITERLRLQLLGALHVGTLRPGARLPSIREVAERSRVDHRLVQRAYRHLEAERLVEIRGRSGVFVAQANSHETQLQDDRLRWLAAVLSDGWRRRMTFAELHNLTRRTTLHGLRCVCLESTTDHLVAFSSELASDFGFTTIPVRFSPSAAGRPACEEVARIEAEIRSADAVATTAFHAAAISEIAARTGKPLITIAVNPAIRDEIAQQLKQGPRRVIVADPLFADRARLFIGNMPGGSNVELVLARDLKRARVDDSIPALYTKAARRELGLPEFHLLSGDVPFIGPESAAQVCALIVRLVDASVPHTVA